MNRHIIQKQIVQLELDDSENFHQLADEFTQMIYQDLLPGLSDKMDLLADEESMIKAGIVEIDLGRINWNNRPSDFIDSMIDKIIYQVRQSFPPTGFEKNSEPELQYTTSQLNRINAWLQYLRTGLMPWNIITADKREEWEVFILRALQSDESESALRLINSIWNDQVALKRLIHTASLPFIETLRKGSGIILQGETELLNFAAWLDNELGLTSKSLERLAWQQISKNEKYEEPGAILLIFLNEAIMRYPGFHWQMVFSAWLRKHHTISMTSINQFLSAFIGLILSAHSQNVLRDLLNSSGISSVLEYISSYSLELFHNSTVSKGDDIFRVGEINLPLPEKTDTGTAQVNQIFNDAIFIQPENTFNEEEPIYISNAGLVILGAYLPHLFEAVGFLQDDLFRDLQSQVLAVKLTSYLATGETGTPEWELSLPKILCGLEPQDTLANDVELSFDQIAESTHLLEAVLQYWTALGNTSPAGLREGFLQRPGKLSLQNEDWLLQVEGRTSDILLERLPWGFGMIHLNWMKRFLRTEWAGYI